MRQRSPQEKSTGPIARLLMPSFGSWSVLIVLYLLVMNAHRFLLDSDTGWHIRTGELIRQTGIAPRHDPFSFTMAGREWLAWEWLTDWMMAGLHNWRGLAGVVAGAFLVLLAAFAALYITMIKRGAHPVIAFAVILFGAVATIVHWLARPHLLSILWLVIWAAAVESYRRRGTRWIYLTPLLIALWANLHGAFVVTYAVLVVYAVGSWIETAMKTGQWLGGEARRSLATYTLVGLLSAMAALVTPYGFKLYGHLWRYLNDDKLLASIDEFQSPNFHSVDGKLIEILLLLGAIAAVNALRQRRFVELGLLLLWSHLTLKSERHVTLAVVMLAPIIAEQLSGLISEFLTWFEQGAGARAKLIKSVNGFYSGIARIDARLTGAFIYAAVLAFIIAAASAPAMNRIFAPRFDPSRHPVAAADFLAAHPPGGHLYASDQFGGYLIYRLFPQVKVFVDGRSDFYQQGDGQGGNVLRDASALATVNPQWQAILRRREIDWLLLRKDEPLALVATLSGEWRKVYEDATTQILTRQSPTNPMQ